jgi:hypothetical protein
MKNIFYGILLGGLAVPIANSVYGIVAWVAYGSSDSNMTFLGLLSYHAITGFFGALVGLVVLSVYGLPLFLLLRRFKLANPVSVAVFCILPWVIIDGLIKHDIHHFIQFAWVSLFSGFAFWFKARNTLQRDEGNA